MRKTLLFALFLYSFSAYAQTWKTLGTPGFSGGLAQGTGMAIAPDGTPYVVYQDGINGPVTVMAYNGSSWVVVGKRGFSSGEAQYVSIAIDPSGAPYVAYMDDAASGYRATVMKFNGTEWVAVGGAAFTDGQAEFTSLAINANGIPFIAFRDDDSSSARATVMYYNVDSSKWCTLGKKWFSDAEVSYISIVIKAYTPYVVFQDGANGPATVMEYIGTGWQIRGSRGFSAGRAAYTSIALSSWGVPYVAYLDGANGYKATVMYCSGTTWTSLGNPGFSPDWAEYTSIALDNNNTPYVAFSDHSDSNKATVMKFDGNNWAIAGNQGFSDGWTSSTCIAFNPATGTPFVAYEDYYNNYGTTVMKLDTSTTVKPLAAAISSLTLTPNPSHGTFTLFLSSPQKETATITITNMLGEKVNEFSVNTNEETQVQLDAAPGVYFVSAATTEGRQSAKVEVW